MNCFSVFIILIISFSLVSCSDDRASNPLTTLPVETISGRTISPVAGILSFVNLALLPDSIFIQSDYDGDFKFENIPSGDYQVTASLPGYFNDTVHITMEEDDYKEIIINLNEIPLDFLTSFTGHKGNASVSLNWTTEMEIENQGFEIQREEENRFITVGFVEGNGTTTGYNSYTYIDLHNNFPISYRLKQISFNGDVKFSPIIEIQ